MSGEKASHVFDRGLSWNALTLTGSIMINMFRSDMNVTIGVVKDKLYRLMQLIDLHLQIVGYTTLNYKTHIWGGYVTKLLDGEDEQFINGAQDVMYWG